MKFFDPQLQLGKQAISELGDLYFLHVVTFCPRTNFKNNDFVIDETQRNEGIIKVTVKLIQDPNVPDFEFITPIVHNVNIGEISLPSEQVRIDVTVEGEVFKKEIISSSRDLDSSSPPKKTTTKTGGQGSVSGTQATADSGVRPIEYPTLFGYCI